MALKSVSTDLHEGLNYNPSGLKSAKLTLQRGQLGNDLGSTPSGIQQLKGGEGTHLGKLQPLFSDDAKQAAAENINPETGARLSTPSAKSSDVSIASSPSLTEFYRKDGKFYTPDGRYIGSTEFGTGAGFKEISAPTAPTAPAAPTVQDLATVKKPDETVKDLNMATVEPPTPPTTIAPPDTSQLEQQVATLRSMVAQGYVPTAEERALEDQLTQLKGAAQMGISDQEGQGRGKVLSLVRGKQEKLTEQANLQAQTLIDQLANMQTERLAKQQAAMTELGYAQDDIDRATEQAQQETQNQINLISSGFVPYADDTEVPEGALTYNIGGQTYYVQPAKEEAATDLIANYQYAQEQGYQGGLLNFASDFNQITSSSGPMTISPGQTGIDPATGQVIFQAAEGSTSLPSSVQEYMFAKNEGSFAGGFGDWIAEKSASGELSQWEAKNIGFYNRAVAAEQDIQNIMPEVGYLGQGILPNWLKGSDFQQYEQAAETWIKAILRQESGSAIPPDELKSYMNTFFPKVGDSDAVIQQKKQARQNAMNALTVGVENQAQTSGIDQTTVNGLQNLLNTGQITQQEYNDYISTYQGFNNDLNTSVKGSSIVKEAQTFTDGSQGGQCGRFVNNLTGIGMGDSFENKLSFVDPTIKTPMAGDVFVMPYSWTGHTGIVTKVTPKADGTFDLVVKDSNWSLDEKVKTHTLNSNAVAGYVRMT